MAVYIITYTIGSNFTRVLYVARSDAQSASQALELAKRQDLIPNGARNFQVTEGNY